MESFKEFYKNNLEERYLNLHTPEEKAKHVDAVWDIMHKSYAPIGGFHTAASKEELIHDTSQWKLAKKGGKIVSATIYKDNNGRKRVASGTDGSPEGKASFHDMHDAEHKTKRSWGEVSGATEHLAKKKGHVFIHNSHAERLTGKKILKLHDDGIHYDRMIAGHLHTKALVGHPNEIGHLTKPD